MKLPYLFLVFTLLSHSLFSQTYSKNMAVPVTASINASFPSITLHWKSQDSTLSYDIYKKDQSSETWTNLIASSLSPTALSYTDTSIEIGKEYEYVVIRNYKPNTSKGYGFIMCAIEREAIYNQGIIILVVDSLSTQGIQSEIKQWINDAEAEGWIVKTLSIDSNDEVTKIRSYIIDIYNDDPLQTKALFLLGRVPVPYSGNLCPDGHSDHIGAWPADGYYADMDGNWTDQSVNSTSSGKDRTINIPGDGKFDQSTFPSAVDLQIGRVDMRNLPLYSKDETTLLKQYLDKNHAYKHKLFSPQNRALVRDNFTSYTEGFAASAINSFYTICDTQHYNIGYNTVLSQNDYQWAYGCGGGTFTSCSGVITSAFLAGDTLKNVFNFLFGSYFGDWDNTSNLLRSALASGSLSVAWSGRPFWYFHHMALGYTIGYSARQSMNNTNTYYPGNMSKGVHITLLGDPTLKAHIIAPPTNVSAQFNGKQCNITWQKSSDNIEGYYVFKRLNHNESFRLLSSSIINDTLFVDRSTSDSGVYQYMVRAVKLESTPSGSYYNLSLGVFDTAYNHQAYVDINSPHPVSSLKIYPNPVNDLLTIENQESVIKEVYVYDMLGKEINKYHPNDLKAKLNIHHLNEGIYILKIKTEEASFIHKIHVSR